jgi:RimJ/RimL family protein N-acetyltransferase
VRSEEHVKDLGDITHPPELSDGRILLRRLRASDKAAVVKACNDGLIERFCYRVPFPYDESDFTEFLAYNEHFWDRELIANWTVVIPGDDEPLAMVSLDVTAVRQAGEIGYWCAPWARGQGVMSAAVRLVRDWAFDELGLERLELTTDVDNVGSQRVAAAAGFHREGVMRGYLAVRGRRSDDVLFGMTRTDLREPQPAPFGAALLSDGRITVRPFEAADVPAVQAACADPAVAHWIYGVPPEYSLADAEAFIADSWRCLAAGTRARLAVATAPGDAAAGGSAGAESALANGGVPGGTRPAGGEASPAGGEASPAGRLLGSISLDLYPARQAGEIGYWMAPEARRQGVAEAAVRLVVHWGFQIVGLERLEIMTYPGNAASQALAQKMGFRREGLLRGYLPAEPGKSREGRVEPDFDGSLAARDDQVLFALSRADRGG